MEQVEKVETVEVADPGEDETKRKARRKRNLVRILVKPATRDVIKKYKPEDFTWDQYLSVLVAVFKMKDTDVIKMPDPACDHELHGPQEYTSPAGTTYEIYECTKCGFQFGLKKA